MPIHPLNNILHFNENWNPKKSESKTSRSENIESDFSPRL